MKKKKKKRKEKKYSLNPHHKMDKQLDPLSSNIAKGLHDKLYDKRKAAALEIERYVRELVCRLINDAIYGK